MGTDDFFKKRRAEREARKHDQRKPIPNSFLIVSEGEKTEKNYFDGLSSYIKTHFGGNIDVIAPQITVEGVGKGTSALIAATEKLVNRSSKMYEHIWVVFDKDDFPDFDEAIALANEKQFKVAWSNQCFEYWLFLHFEYSDSALHRNMWSDKLNKIFIEHGLNSEGYQKNLTNIFELVTRDKGLKCAFSYANRRISCFEVNCSPSQCDPCTTVYKIIDELKEFLSDLL